MSNDTLDGPQRRHPSAICEECTLCDPQLAYIASTGPISASIAIVGESPGYQEERVGIPFSGPGGKLLDGVLTSTKLKRSQLFLTTTVLCRTPDNRAPTKREQAACWPRLKEELDSLSKLETIMALGNVASQALLETTEGITSLRVGSPKSNDRFPGVKIIPTFHPAACLRVGDNFPSLMLDFKKVRSYTSEWYEPIVKVFDTAAEALAVLEELAKSTYNEIVIDIEVGIEKDTDFQHPERFEFLCVGICYTAGKTIIIGEEALKADTVRAKLIKVLQGKKIICHNGKFDLAGLSVWGKLDLWFDTMLAHYVTDERRGTHSLSYLATELIGAPDWKDVLDEWVGSGKRKASYANVPRDILYKYCGFDCHNTYLLYEYFSKDLDQTPKFRQLHDDLVDISSMLQYAEQKGIAYDIAYFEQLDNSYFDSLRSQREAMEHWVANPNSWIQVQKALTKMKVSTESTDDLHLEIILRKVAFDSEPAQFVRALRAYRKDFKQYSVYVRGMIERGFEGRLHTNFIMHGTTSGRLAAKEPNLLNVTRGPLIKTGFVPDPDHVFVQADYKTAELRVVGVEANCPWLIEVLSDPLRDIHGEVATQRYGPGWTKDQRVRAKAVVFGLGYGREAGSIATEFDIPLKEAEEVVRAFFELIPEVKEWQQYIKHQVTKLGVDLTNHFGRKRRFHLISKDNVANVGRESLAFIPQSTANDINLRAATKLYKELGMDVRLLVHDSCLVNCPPDEAEQVARVMSRVMQDTALQYTDVIPFYVDTSIGNNWGELS